MKVRTSCSCKFLTSSIHRPSFPSSVNGLRLIRLTKWESEMENFPYLRDRRWRALPFPVEVPISGGHLSWGARLRPRGLQLTRWISRGKEWKIFRDPYFFPGAGNPSVTSNASPKSYYSPGYEISTFFCLPSWIRFHRFARERSDWLIDSGKGIILMKRISTVRKKKQHDSPSSRCRAARGDPARCPPISSWSHGARRGSNRSGSRSEMGKKRSGQTYRAIGHGEGPRRPRKAGRASADTEVPSWRRAFSSWCHLH